MISLRGKAGDKECFKTVYPKMPLVFFSLTYAEKHNLHRQLFMQISHCIYTVCSELIYSMSYLIKLYSDKMESKTEISHVMSSAVKTGADVDRMLRWFLRMENFSVTLSHH